MGDKHIRNNASQNLCDAHAELINTKPQQAFQFWQSARAQGVAALQQGEMASALQHLSVVFEIARIQFAEDIARGTLQISAERFAESARYQVWVLGRAEKFNDALVCLQVAHDGLLHRASNIRIDYVERIHAFELMREFRLKRIALLNMQGKSGCACACAWGRAAEALTDKAKVGLVH